VPELPSLSVTPQDVLSAVRVLEVLHQNRECDILVRES
jgi:hypothetical protein